jgi:MFS family permease
LVFIVANIIITFVYAQGDSSLIQYLTRANTPDLISLISSMIVLNATLIVTFQFPLLKLMEKMTVMHRIYVGIVLLAISQLICAFNPVDYYAGWLFATFVLSIGEAILFPNMSIQLDQLAPAHLRGSYFGAASLYTLGYACAPLIGGLILDAYSGMVLFIMAAVLSLLVLLMYIMTRQLKRPDYSQQAIET